MKTIATAGARESLVQLNKARKVAARLVENVKISEIRSRQPETTGNETPEELDALNKAQGFKNFSDIVDALIEKNLDDFFELASLLIFQTKAKTETMPLKELINPMFELWNTKAVQDFLASLGQSGGKRG